MCRYKLTRDEKEERREKNREGMRKIRQRQRLELQRMKTAIVLLEKQYAELNQRATTAELSNDVQTTGSHTDIAAKIKQLGAEKLFLLTELKQQAAWKQIPGDCERTLDEDEAEKELGYHSLTTEWVLTRTILDNKRIIHRVENRLQSLPELVDKRTHRMQAFGWDIVQRVEGSVMEFVFTKRFTDLNVLDIMHKTWTNDIQLAHFRTVKAETSRLQLLQQLDPNALVFVRDVGSIGDSGDISIFRSVFVHFLVEASREFTDPNHDTITGSGYVLGTQSVPFDNHSIEPHNPSRKLAWADLSLTTEVNDVIDVQTTNKSGQTDYQTEEDAQRNAADTLQSLLCWEMNTGIVAPALFN